MTQTKTIFDIPIAACRSGDPAFPRRLGDPVRIPDVQLEHPAMPGQQHVRALAMGPDGLWIGYADGFGIDFYDSHAWHHMLDCPYVTCIALDGQDLPCAGTYGDGVYSWDGVSWDRTTGPVPDPKIYGLSWRDDRLIASTWTGITQFDGYSWTVPDDLPDSIRTEHVSSTAFSPNGDIWIGTLTNGVYRMTPDGDAISRDLPPFAAHSTLIHARQTGRVKRIAVHPDGGSVWAATDGGGIGVYTYASRRWRSIRVGDNRVTDIGFDPFGRVWAATLSGVYINASDRWVRMTPYASYAVAFGSDTSPFPRELVFMGTDAGLVMAMLPEHPDAPLGYQ